MNSLLREFDSEDEQLTYLHGVPAWVLLNRENEYPNRFCAAEVRKKSGERIRIGMTLTFYGIDPTWILSGDEDALAVGYDERISFVDMSNVTKKSDIKLEGRFYEFIPEPRGYSCIALHELGVAKFSFSGTELWSVSTPDIAETAGIVGGDRIVVRHQGPGGTMAIDLESGRVCSVESSS